MRVTVVHGYFLHDSGSAIYTRELARELARAGHEVTLVCQEQHPESFGFIDSVYDLDTENLHVIEFMRRQSALNGSCRLVRPHLSGNLLTYVAGPFPGFTAVPFQEVETDQIESYINANTRALETVFDIWPPDLVQANHAIMQPLVVRRALAGRAPYVVTVHGSELNFSIKSDPRLVPYALEGLERATAVFALSDSSLEELREFADAHGMDLGSKAMELSPGVDTELFSPARDRSGLPESIFPLLDEAEKVLVFAGRLLWTKGLQYVVAGLPLILAQRPDLQLLVAGEGPMLIPILAFIDALGSGDFDKALELLTDEPQLRTEKDFGDVLPAMNTVERELYLEGSRSLGDHIHFLGHLSHDQLAGLFAAADISLAPSVFPEAFGLVSIEALAAGALPVATYQTGLKTPLNAVAALLVDDTLRNLRPGVALTTAIAGSVLHLLRAYPTRDRAFRQRLHSLVEDSFSWKVVADRMLEFSWKSFNE